MIVKPGKELFREQTKDTLIIHKEILTESDEVYGILEFDCYQTHDGETWCKLILNIKGFRHGRSYYTLYSMDELFKDLVKELKLELTYEENN